MSFPGSRQDCYGSLFQLVGQLSVGSSSVQLMDDRPVSFVPQFAQEPSHLPVRNADLLGRLSLGNQFLLSPLQGIQPISFGLLHQ